MFLETVLFYVVFLVSELLTNLIALHDATIKNYCGASAAKQTQADSGTMEEYGARELHIKLFNEFVVLSP